MAAGTIVVETSYPLSLFSRRLRVPLVLGGMSLIIGIRMLMGPTFEQFLVINVFWVPWDRVGERLRAWSPRRTDMRVIYDGACGLCRPTVAVLRRLDLRRRVEFLDVHRDWPAIHERFPQLSREACLTDMHGIDRSGRRVRRLRHLPSHWHTCFRLGGSCSHSSTCLPFPGSAAACTATIADRRHAATCAMPLRSPMSPSSSETDPRRPGRLSRQMTMSDALDISVVVPTFDRGPQLEPLLTSLLDQDAGALAYEIVVVDNNSTDDTRSIVARVASRDPRGRLRYVFEPRQGVSYARNTGVAQTTAPIVAFLDDDGVPGRDWVREMKRAFDEHPEVDCIGGRIKPRWVHPRPSWLTAAHWGPIAVQDRPTAAYLNLQQASVVPAQRQPGLPSRSLRCGWRVLA